MACRLRDEEHIWLTTVRADGLPLPTLVWFLWEQDETVLIYSQPNKQKLLNITRNPKVALNFNSDVLGDDMIIFERRGAQPEADAAVATEHPAYLGIGGASSDRHDARRSFAKSYSVAIRVTPTKVRGF